MKKKGRGIIERIFVGKPRESDFTESDMPSNRFKQFRFVFRTRFGVIFRANMLSALFFLPYLAWDLLSGGYVEHYIADLTVGERLSSLSYLSLLQYGTEIPLIMLGFAGLSGIYYVIRRICWGQSVKIVPDFIKGLKDSFLQFIMLGLLTGVINLLVRYIVDFSILTMAGGNALLWGLAVTAAILFAVIYCVALMFALCQSSLYKLSFGRLIANSYILAFKRLLRSLAACLCSLAPVIVFAVMPWTFVKIIGDCVIIVFSIGFAATVQTVFCHWVFDDFINGRSYPDYVGMGLAGGKLPEELSGGSAEETDDKSGENNENNG